jgi:hypothetical protein
MHMQFIGMALGAIGGGLFGYSQVFCSTGQCVLTGSWYGGAVVGGLLGFLAADMFRRKPAQPIEPLETERQD